MIVIHHRGRLGNALFQYSFGRILAERFGYALSCHKIRGFSNATPVDGARHDKRSRVYLTYNNIDRVLSDIKNNKHHRVVMNIGFQQYAFYRDYKEKIRGWLKPDLQLDRNDLSGLDFREKKDGKFEKIKVDEITDDDIVVMQRLHNFVRFRMDLKINYFNTILKTASFRRLFITSDDFNSEMLDGFAPYNPIFLFGPPLVHYSFASLFNKMVMSQSTFCWWIAWMSDATEIYFPFTANGYWSKDRFTRGDNSRINLVVDDEDRYRYVREYQWEGEYRLERAKDILKLVGIQPK